MQTTCTATQLIEALRKLVEQYGDLPVYSDDPDTSWKLPIGLVLKPANKSEGWPKRFEIKTSYYDRPEGDLVSGVDYDAECIRKYHPL